MSAVGLFVVILTLLVLIWQVRLARTAYSQKGMRQFLFDEYVGHRFVTVESVTLPRRHGGEVKLVRLAKLAAWEEWKDDEERWKLNSTCGRGTWEAETAGELAQVLENMGQATITGALPLNLVLAFFGNTIIEDWLLCRHWVAGHREERGLVKGGVEFHRRHAEWLAVICALWMKEWGGETAQKVINHYQTEKGALDRIEAISRESRIVYSPYARWSVWWRVKRARLRWGE